MGVRVDDGILITLRPTRDISDFINNSVFWQEDQHHPPTRLLVDDLSSLIKLANGGNVKLKINVVLILKMKFIDFVVIY